MRSSVAAPAGVSKTIAREWKGMAFSSCRALAETKHASESESTRQESAQPLIGQAEVASELNITGQELGECVVRSVEKLRLKEL